MPQLYQTVNASTGTGVVGYSVFPAAKGLASGITHPYVPPENVIQSNNLVHSYELTRRTRQGIEAFVQSHDFGDKVNWLDSLWRLNPLTGIKSQQLVAIANSTFWVDPGTGTFEDRGSIGAVEGPVTSDVLIGLMMVGIKGSGLYTYTNVGGLTAVADAPNTYIVRQHRGAFWTAGDPVFPDTIFKASGESTSFVGGSAREINLDLGNNDSTGITAIFPEYLGRLYVSKENSIYEVDTSVANVPVRPLGANLGSISHNAVVSVGNDVIFPSNRGLHSLVATVNYGDIEDRFLSRPIHNLWKESIDLSRGQEISASFDADSNSYLMLYPVKNSDTYNLLGYNLGSGDFYLWEDYHATYINNYIDGVDNGIRTLVGTKYGKVGRIRKLTDTTYMDFSKSYETSFTTPPIFFGGVPLVDYNFQNLTVFFIPRKGIIYIDYVVGNNSARTISFDQDVLTANGKYSYIRLPLTGYGQSISLRFYTQPAGISEEAAMEIIGYNIEGIPTGTNFSLVQST